MPNDLCKIIFQNPWSEDELYIFRFKGIFWIPTSITACYYLVVVINHPESRFLIFLNWTLMSEVWNMSSNIYSYPGRNYDDIILPVCMI